MLKAVCGKKGRAVRRLAVALAAVAALQGCSTVDWVMGRPPKVAVDKIQLVADSDANGRRPVPVDVVRVGNTALAEQLAKVPSQDWFANRAQILRDNPGSAGIVSWEVVPGQRIGLRDLPPFDGRVIAVFVFAGYTTPADHRFRVASEDAIVVHLLKDTFTVETLTP